MQDIRFIVEALPIGGYLARAVGHDILTEAENLPDLQAQVRDAVHYHFDAGQKPVYGRCAVLLQSAAGNKAEVFPVAK
jgi:hypothetical protein